MTTPAAYSMYLTDTLNQQVANFSVLYMKLHHYHWYVKGENFFTLHIKFEELYTEVGVHLDAIAERMLALQTIPTATLKEHLATATIKEATGEEDAKQMVEALSEDLESIMKEIKIGITLAEEHRDQSTADMLIAIHSSFEKHRWMLDAYLGK
ncbi:Dps family protein [Brevibacillus nitrificans]|nr:DNA starvation/stationary phase protection protein [Brevibacillus nitrificans]